MQQPNNFHKFQNFCLYYNKVFDGKCVPKTCEKMVSDIQHIYSQEFGYKMCRHIKFSRSATNGSLTVWMHIS